MFEVVIAISVLVLIPLGFLGSRWWRLRRVNRVSAPLTEDFPDNGFSHDIFQSLLRRFVSETGRVDYQGWHGDAVASHHLAQYIAAIQRYSPSNAPERFPHPAHRLAYWINAYNALVICSVLRNWPLNSVTEVKAPIEIKKGMGFFYLQRHIVGGMVMSLYELEHKRLIGKGADPRVHFLLNCATASCPLLRPVTGDSAELEGLLVDAAAEFVGAPNHLRIDHAKRLVTLSPIFEWYMADFTAGFREKELSPEQRLLCFIASVALPDLSRELEQCLNYGLEFSTFDWSINTALKVGV